MKSDSKRLTDEFGKGFDASNLWNMRQFYQTYPIFDAVRRENIIIGNNRRSSNEKT